MHPSEKPQFLAVLNGLAAVKPGAKLTREAYEVWWLALQDWPFDQFREAAAHLTKSMEFMPSPFHFEQLRKAQRPVAAEAWLTARKVWKSAAALGGGRVTSGDETIDRAIETLGGYGAMAMSDTSKLHFHEKRFAEVYASLQDAQEVRQALPQLGGGFGLAELTKRREQRQIVKQA